ncbi:MAG: MurR/RpiR family transcriptional regulator, partial [Spirochaetota bacterium]
GRATVFTKLVKDRFEDLSAGQKKVARYALNTLDKVSYQTIAQISQANAVSETTVVRLAYALGFSGFSDMQKMIRDEVLSSLDASAGPGQEVDSKPVNIFQLQMKREIQALQSMIKQLDYSQIQRVVELLRSSKSVFLVGFRTSAAATIWFYTILSIIRDTVYLVNNPTEVSKTLLNVDANSLVVAVGYSRYTKESVQFVKHAHDQKATIVAVTDNSLSPLARLADVPFIVPPTVGETGFNSIAAAISLLNLFVTGMNREPSVRERIERLEKLYTEHSEFYE